MNQFLSCSTSLFPDGEHIEMAIEVVRINYTRVYNLLLSYNE